MRRAIPNTDSPAMAVQRYCHHPVPQKYYSSQGKLNAAPGKVGGIVGGIKCTLLTQELWLAGAAAVQYRLQLRCGAVNQCLYNEFSRMASMAKDFYYYTDTCWTISKGRALRHEYTNDKTSKSCQLVNPSSQNQPQTYSVRTRHEQDLRIRAP